MITGMEALLGDIFALAISPMAFIAMILILFSPRVLINGVSFLAGWFSILAALGTLTLLFSGSQDMSSGSRFNQTIPYILLGLGVFLLIFALLTWMNRPRPGSVPKTPWWMAAIDSLTPLRAFGLGAALALINPKNISAIIAATVTLLQSGRGLAAGWLFLTLLILITSMSAAIPLLIYLAAGQRAESALNRGKNWLVTHNSLVMTGVYLFLGLLLIGRSLGPLGS
jgi:threonine/homoserine/homoserine lactone efflux protein